MLIQRFAGLLIGFIYKIWSSTYRYHLTFEDPADRTVFFQDLSTSEPNPGQNLIYACFHQDDMSCLPYFKDRKICALVSASKDGRMLAEAMDFFGYETVMGSSHRKAVSGLLAAMRKVQDGHKFTIAVDGPRGPYQVVKEGICHLSLKTKRPIVPVKAHPRWAWIAKKSWSKTALPMPFGRIDIVIGKIGFYETLILQEKLRSL